MGVILLILLLFLGFAIIKQFIAKKSWEKEKQHIKTISKLDGKEKKEPNIQADYIKMEGKRLKNEGSIFSGKHKYGKSILAYSKAIELDPSDSETYQLRASEYMLVYILNKGSKSYWDSPKEYLQKSIDDYTKSIELSPLDFKSYRCRAFLFLESGRYQEAINDATKSIELSPENDDAFWTRGKAYEALGKTEQAVSDIKESAKLGCDVAQQYLKKKRISF